jgi:hypothetical protein
MRGVWQRIWLLETLSVRKNCQRIHLFKICSMRGICQGIGLLGNCSIQEYETIGLFAICSVRGIRQGGFYWKFVIRGECAKMLDLLENCKFKRMRQVSVLSETWNIMEMWQGIGLFQTFSYSPELGKNWKIALSVLSMSVMHTKKKSRKTVNIYNW